MTRQLIPIFALIAGSAFLMIAGGLHGLILPLRGSYEGFSTLSLGLLGTGWAIGYVAGCLRVPMMVPSLSRLMPSANASPSEAVRSLQSTTMCPRKAKCMFQ